jgi:predicted DNA-binding transcriptional regulator AlpA
MLNKQEVATRLRVSERQVEVLVTARRLPRGARLGKHVYWDSAVIDEYCNALFSHQKKWLDARAVKKGAGAATSIKP